MSLSSDALLAGGTFRKRFSQGMTRTQFDLFANYGRQVLIMGYLNRNGLCTFRQASARRQNQFTLARDNEPSKGSTSTKATSPLS